MRLSLILFGLALLPGLVSCRGVSADEAASSLATTDSSALRKGMDEVHRLEGAPAPANADDSLSYYLGMSEGAASEGFLKGVPAEVRDSISRDSYLLGLYASLAADTTTCSYAIGVKSVDEIVRYLSLLEMKGVKFNRRVLAARMVELLSDPGIKFDRAYADSITNQIIMRNFK